MWLAASGQHAGCSYLHGWFFVLRNWESLQDTQLKLTFYICLFKMQMINGF